MGHPSADNLALLAGDGYTTIVPPMLREAIIAARDKRGWSTNRLATEAGVPQSRLSDFLAGKATIHSDHVVALLRTLGIDFKPAKSPRKEAP